MKQNNVLPNAHTYSILMTACSKQKQSIDLCFQILEAMHANHIQPVPQTYMPLIPLIFKFGQISHYNALYKDIKTSEAGDKVFFSIFNVHYKANASIKLLYHTLFEGLQGLRASGETVQRGFTAVCLKQLLADLHAHMQALNLDPPPLLSTRSSTKNNYNSSHPGIKDMLDCL